MWATFKVVTLFDPVEPLLSFAWFKLRPRMVAPAMASTATPPIIHVFYSYSVLLFLFSLFCCSFTNPFDSFFINVTWNGTIGTDDQACRSCFCDDAFGFCLDRSLVSCVEKTILPFSKPPRTVRPPKISRPSARLMPSGPTAQLMTWAG